MNLTVYQKEFAKNVIKNEKSNLSYILYKGVSERLNLPIEITILIYEIFTEELNISIGVSDKSSRNDKLNFNLGKLGFNKNLVKTLTEYQKGVIKEILNNKKSYVNTINELAKRIEVPIEIASLISEIYAEEADFILGLEITSFRDKKLNIPVQ